MPYVLFQVDDVTYEGNTEPASEGGAEDADDTQGSDLVMRTTGDEAVSSAVENITKIASAIRCTRVNGSSD